MSRFRARSLVIRVSLVCALLLSACSPLPSVLGQPKFQADALVGADTWSFTDITLRPSLEQALRTREVLDLFDGPAADAGFDVHHLPTPSGREVDFEKDVLPHLDGEFVVAVSGPVDDPDLLFLVHTNDVEGTLGLLADEAQPRLSKDGRGVMRFASDSGPAQLAAYKDWIIYTESDALREQTLDRIDGKGSPGLASDAKYQATVDRLKGDRLGFGYLNVAPVVDRALAEEPQLASTVHSRGRLAYSFGFEPGPASSVYVLGLRLEYIPDPALNIPVPGNGDTLQAMDRLPKASMLAFAGPDIGIYSESISALNSDPDVDASLHALLEQFAGPYAFGVTKPARQLRGISDESFDDVLGSVIGGLFFLGQVAPDADPGETSDIVTELVDSVFSDEDLAWEHEVVIDNNWLAINAVPPPLALNDVPEDLLASDKLYQWVRAGFIPNGSNMYVNLDAIETSLLGGVLSADELSALRVFQAIGVSAQTEPRGDTHAHMTVLIVP